MKLVILAAGYATRLHPLTLTQPKALLEVAGRPIIERLIESLVPIKHLSEIFVVTNAKFAAQFSEWASRRTKDGLPPLTVLSDGSISNDNRLGAIGSLNRVLSEQELNEELLVVAGDNLFSRSLESFGEYCRRVDAPVLGVYDVGRFESAKRYSEVHTNMDGQITSFEEKPESPTTTMIGVALYYYPVAAIAKIKQYIEGENDLDKPGRLIQWLYPRVPVYTWAVPGIWYDIGSKETLEEANRIFQGR